MSVLDPSEILSNEWLQAKEFELLHDRFDSVDAAVANLRPPMDDLDIIIWSLCFVLGFLFGAVVT